MQHGDFWKALDKLAQRNGMTPSGLARSAGLDPTTFNKSKRVSPAGQQRWVSTENLARVLKATGSSLEDFGALVDKRSGRNLPILGFAKAGTDGYFDEDGFPIEDRWNTVRFPGIGDEAAYALEIAGDSMEPLYRNRDRLIVGPSVEVKKGDRAVVRFASSEVVAKEIGRMDTRSVELISLNPAYGPRTAKRAELSWMARILWVSQ